MVMVVAAMMVTMADVYDNLCISLRNHPGEKDR